ncbi:hypothetical protein Q5H91_12850 [Sphingomonas sp. KR1UV-12]|uniref:YihY/virulence factor BrkB family protein n=1 Tax=Sphingomonas aurea TaxID=3063994 RepID=A0ABT9EMC9_9SPHN|nr:hypothetical protein [Sphingomonas sp. KR1UV-12]MDP1028104.1 hypothetical protein [Sphingomonas sp. KR1UV-12]
MNEAEGAAPRLREGWLRRAARRIGSDVAEVYRRGGKGVLAAPLIAAIAILPEAAQHVVEIKLGMFQSREVFRALSNDPSRWAFGYAKIAGFVIAMLAYARFHALGSVRAALMIRPLPLLKTMALVGLTAAVSAGLARVGTMTGSAVLNGVTGAVSLVLQSGLMLLIVATLIEDRTLDWRAAFTTHLPSAALLTLYLLVAFAPAQLLHMANHWLALGRPAPIVWGLMTFDALSVGLLAALVGAAMMVGVRARITWRGWVARCTEPSSGPVRRPFREHRGNLRARDRGRRGRPGCKRFSCGSINARRR